MRPTVPTVAEGTSLAFGSQEGLCKGKLFDDNLLLHLDRHVHAVIIRAVDTPYRHTSDITWRPVMVSRIHE